MVAERILVPLDGSLVAEQAIPYALAIGGPHAEIILLAVLTQTVPTFAMPNAGATPGEDLLRRERRAATQALQDAAARWGADVAAHFEPAVAIGDPAAEIIRMAKDREVDFIAVTSHGRGAGGRWTYGAVADRVARAAAVPVLVVRASEAAPVPAATVQRLLVPLDGSALAARALPVAAPLAKRLRVPINLVSVLDPSAMVPSTVAYGATVSDDLYQEMATGVQAVLKHMLERTTAALQSDGIQASWQIQDGPVASSIMLAARPGDIIVLSSHGRGGITRWLLGSVAEKLLRLASAPVLLVPSKAAETASGAYAEVVAAAVVTKGDRA